DQNIGDDNYLHYLELIEKKAKLDVNEGKKRPTVIASAEGETKKPNANNEEKPKTETTSDVADNSSPKDISPSKDNSSPKQNINNKQLADIAKQDAAESKKEAIQLERDSQEAF